MWKTFDFLQHVGKSTWKEDGPHFPGRSNKKMNTCRRLILWKNTLFRQSDKKSLT